MCVGLFLRTHSLFLLLNIPCFFGTTKAHFTPPPYYQHSFLSEDEKTRFAFLNGSGDVSQVTVNLLWLLCVWTCPQQWREKSVIELPLTWFQISSVICFEILSSFWLWVLIYSCNAFHCQQKREPGWWSGYGGYMRPVYFFVYFRWEFGGFFCS